MTPISRRCSSPTCGCPADALLGPLNGGWQIATTTLSHERAGAARLYTEMQVRLEELVTDLADVRIAGRPVLEDPTTLRRLGEIALRIKYLEVLCQRSISAILHGGEAFASASLAKTIWGEIGQDLAALAFDLLGPHVAQVGRLSPDVALAHHRGRDDADQQEHHRAACARVAALMNLELTDEQVALRDTVRRFLAEKASIAEHVRPMLEDPTGTTEVVWRGLADLGTTGLLVPSEYGGAGMTMVEAGIVARGTRRRTAPRTVAVQCGRRDSRVDAVRGRQPRRRSFSPGIADGSTHRCSRAALTAFARRSANRVTASCYAARSTACSMSPRPTSCWCWLTMQTGTGLFAVQTSAPGLGVTPQTRNRPDPQAVSRHAR